MKVVIRAMIIRIVVKMFIEQGAPVRFIHLHLLGTISMCFISCLLCFTWSISHESILRWWHQILHLFMSDLQTCVQDLCQLHPFVYCSPKLNYTASADCPPPPPPQLRVEVIFSSAQKMHSKNDAFARAVKGVTDNECANGWGLWKTVTNDR